MSMPPTGPPANSSYRHSLVADLEGLLDHAAGGPLKIADALSVLSQRGPAMVMLLLALPCVVPGVSAVMAYVTGPAVTLFGLQLMFRLPPWLPKWIGRRQLSNKTLGRMVGFARRWIGPTEKLLRPRLKFMLSPVSDVVVGLALAFLGVFLFVPWLIPLSNEIPALVIVVLLLGLIERDGIFIIVGLLLTLAIAAACGYVCTLFWKHGIKGGLKIIRHLRHPATTSS